VYAGGTTRAILYSVASVAPMERQVFLVALPCFLAKFARFLYTLGFVVQVCVVHDEGAKVQRH